MDWEPTVGARLAATLAYLFDNAPEKVGYAFWGYIGMSVIKKDMGLSELECIINDDHLQRAIDLLVASGYSRCSDRTCTEFNQVRPSSEYNAAHHSSTHPVGVAHFHLQDGVILHLLPQWAICPWMEPIGEGELAADDPDLILTTDPTLPPAREDGPTGRWSELLPVKILNANRFTESLIWLMCRDLRRNGSLFRRWNDMLATMHDTRRSTRRLRPEFQPAWDCLQHRGDYADRKLHMFHELILLRERLIASRSLPRNLPNIDIRDWSIGQSSSWRSWLGW